MISAFNHSSFEKLDYNKFFLRQTLVTSRGIISELESLISTKEKLLQNLIDENVIYYVYN